MMDAYIYLRKKHKLVHTSTVNCPEGLVPLDTITECLEPVLVPWDIPRPIVLARHCRDLESFGRVIFRPSDFVEPFPYDQLEVELSVRPEGISEEFFDEIF